MSFFKVTASPHVHSNENSRSIMMEVIIALLPAFIWGIYAFGSRVILITLVTVVSCVLSEYIYRKLAGKSSTVGDLSAVVTGLLLSLTLPVSVPLWICVIGAVFAIVVVKQLFGGLGKNIVNPALAARVFLFTSFPTHLSTYYDFGERFSFFEKVSEVDAVACSTPLSLSLTQKGSIIDLLLGNHAGSIGEVSELLLLLGGLYLLFNKVITWHIPVAFLGTVAVITYVFPIGTDSRFEFMFAELFTGGLVIGAFFMATDYVTCPVTKLGRIIFGIGCGIITVFIRYFGGYPEGVSFAILIMNLLVWYIDMFTRPKVFGGVKHAKSK